MQTRELGRSGLQVSALGLGCMGISFSYATALSKDDGVALIRAAVERGVTFFDTAEVYGPVRQRGSRWRGAASVPRPGRHRHQVRLRHRSETRENRGVSSRPERIRQAVEGSLKRLGVETIDLLYQHRVDPERADRRRGGAVKDLIAQGKVKHFGMSEPGVQTLRRAHAVQPVAALQNEYSLWWRAPETNGVLEACDELGIGFVPYSPLGKGFLTGAMSKDTELGEGDFRKQRPPILSRTRWRTTRPLSIFCSASPTKRARRRPRSRLRGCLPSGPRSFRSRARRSLIGSKRISPPRRLS